MEIGDNVEIISTKGMFSDSIDKEYKNSLIGKKCNIVGILRDYFIIEFKVIDLYVRSFNIKKIS